jgi:hypothetical protein
MVTNKRNPIELLAGIVVKHSVKTSGAGPGCPLEVGVFNVVGVSERRSA